MCESGAVKLGRLALTLTLFIAPARLFGSPLEVQMTLVPGSDVEPSGPVHDFRIGVYEVTHDEFCAFLNDALANLDNERGQYLYFDTDTGDVYVHNSITGVLGTTGSGTLIFDASVTGGIGYDLLTGTYFVNSGFELHPVAGVSWYGAVKFCNWLTLDQGLAADEQAYQEAPSTNLGGWHPVVISDADWAVRNMDDAERAEWVSEYSGFRLPMDGGATTAGLYNEWYKAAAWLPIAGQHAVYGFVRDIITGADANYFCSGDEFESGEDCVDGASTPAGYYDGTLKDPDGIALLTVDTANGYGLYDISGNVWEWLTDQRTSPSFRSVRGGSWNSSTTSLKNMVFASSTPGFIQSQGTYGFRVAQSVANTIDVEPETIVVVSGPFGGPYSLNEQLYTIINYSSSDSLVSVVPDVSWLTINGMPLLLDFPISAYSQEVISVSWSADCTGRQPPVGTVTGTLLFTSTGGVPIEYERQIEVTVSEPVTLTPAESLPFSIVGFFDGPFPSEQVNTLTSASVADIAWTAQADGDWVLVQDGASAYGTLGLVNGQSVDIELGISETAEAFDIGTYTSTVSFTDVCTGLVFTRNVVLTIEAPLSVSPEDLAFSGVSGGPFDPEATEVIITNVSDRDVQWVMDSEATWLSIDGGDGTSGLLSPGAEAEIEFTVNSSANILPVGEYESTISVRDESDENHIYEVELVVVLDVTELDVQPTDSWLATGPDGGPFIPAEQIYVIANHSLFEFEWTASSDVDWIDLNGEPSTGGVILEPEGTAEVVATVNSAANVLPNGTYTGTITFVDLFTQAQSTRMVTLEVGGHDFDVPTVLVPQSAVQLGGPDYDFRIGRYELTNDEFAFFLNNAVYSLDDPRGHYMYHDIDSGDVYLAGSESGVVGTSGSGTLLFSSVANGAISFDGESYAVADGAGVLPAGGITWYGAVKFCNWLTLTKGMAESERVYHEGPTAAEWYPVTIGSEVGASQASTYAVRDLSDSERDALVNSYAGFRLPMDGGAGALGPYNEWYKAAAMGTDGGTAKIYGFGRDVITGADANVLASGDTFEPGATPIGYFDSTIHDGVFVTSATDNLFGIYDLCGNVREWTNDHGLITTERALRGGQYQNAIDSILNRNDQRASRPSGEASSVSGFRIAQSVVGASFLVEHPDLLIFDGPFGGAFEPESYFITLMNDGEQTRQWSVSNNESWTNLHDELGRSTGTLAPGETQELTLTVNDEAYTLVPRADSDPDLAFIPSYDEEPEGPAHSFWLDRYEVTNQEFVSFLNDALVNFDNERGAYLYVESASGAIYVNLAEVGQLGDAEGAVDLPLLFDPAMTEVTFDGVAFAIVDGYESRPVSGVTWLGSLKYCNWLTLNRGYAPGQRCYTEGSHRGDWHPVTISTLNWWGTDDTAAHPDAVGGARDLNDSERSALADQYSGFRLPMDGGAELTGAFNEWYKAASWQTLPANTGVDGVPAGARGSGIHHAYGFGRDEINGADANFGASGDPWSEGKSPVGSYDGSVYDSAGAVIDDPVPAGETWETAEAGNSYGLLDLCGNVAEWIQDRGPNLGYVTRGGHWASGSSSLDLRADHRTALTQDTAVSTIGFRVAQSRRGYDAALTIVDETINEDINIPVTLFIDEPLIVLPIYGLDLDGKYGEDLTDRFISYQLYNSSSAALGWTVNTTAAWVSVTPANGDLTDLGPGESRLLTLDINEEAGTLPPGLHTAVITVTDGFTGGVSVREVSIDIDPSLEIEPGEGPTFSGYWGGPLDPVESIYTVSNQSAKPIDVELSVDVDWLDLAFDSGETTELLSMEGEAQFLIQPLDEINELAVGTYSPVVIIKDSTSGFEIALTGSVEILDLLEVNPPSLDSSGPYGGPLSPQIFVVGLTNRGSITVDYDATSSESWLLVDGGESGAGSLDPDESASLTLTLSESAATLPEGTHTASLEILNYQTGYTHTLEVTVTIDEGLSISPVESLDFYAATGQSSDPSYQVYRLTNLDATPVSYQVTCDQAWLKVDGAATITDTMDVGQVRNLVVTVDSATTETMPAGDYSATIAFDNLTSGFGSTDRVVNLHLVDSVVGVEVAGIEAGGQPNGPSYEFSIGRYEVTKGQFVGFLNDAMANLGSERGQYLYFDVDSGDVYIHSDVQGVTGTGGSGTLIFDLSIDGHITFDGLKYAVDVNYANHPAVGMSWYGAVKFCNWLTLDQGLAPWRRCYVEGPANEVLTAWRPASIDANAWSVGDLSDSQRIAMVIGFGGYRLAMDDGSSNSDPAKDSADGYNEWYKAAAWNTALSKNTLYGFGRDTFTGADANYLASGDPFESGTTPAGYYDGTDHGGIYATQDTANSAGLYDLSGNVAEWVQDRYVGTATMAIRGGSYAGSLKDLTVRSANFPSSPNFTVGMRVVRVTPISAGDGDADGDLDLLDMGDLQSCFTGPVTGTLPIECVPFDSDLDSDIDVSDFALFQAGFSGPDIP